MPDNQARQAVVSWREYTDARIGALEMATTIAREAMEKRLDSMNEFRGALKDQAHTAISRAEYEAKHEMLSVQIAALRRLADVAEGKASQSSVVVGYLFSALSAILAIIALVKELAFK